MGHLFSVPNRLFVGPYSGLFGPALLMKLKFNRLDALLSIVGVFFNLLLKFIAVNIDTICGGTRLPDVVLWGVIQYFYFDLVLRFGKSFRFFKILCWFWCH